jgi:hypothetical protein
MLELKKYAIKTAENIPDADTQPFRLSCWIRKNGIHIASQSKLVLRKCYQINRNQNLLLRLHKPKVNNNRTVPCIYR